LDLPYYVGALYSRKADIHSIFGGQQQQGICTPKNRPFIIAFTGEAGAVHGYTDFWDDSEIFHYFGEGQKGHMRYLAGNRAIEHHVKDGKRLLLFQMMGKGKPYRFLGEFIALSSYIRADTPDTNGTLRDAIVFRLKALTTLPLLGSPDTARIELQATDDSQQTSKEAVVDVRTKQRLFRERLIGVEKGCRLTGIEDLRFLRASHIKPWSLSNATERTDGENGLLLTPSADLLFDQGWISFGSTGKALFSENLPSNITKALGVGQRRPRYAAFSQKQSLYLEFHRDVIYQG